jgi:hypothetical protein
MPVDKNIPLRKGDIVNLRCTVEYASPDQRTIKVLFDYVTLYPERDQCELVLPKFNVGEWVQCYHGRAVIKAIIDQEAWIEPDDDEVGPYVENLSALTRAPAIVQADGESYNAAVLELPSIANDPDDAAIGAIGPDEDEPHWTVGPMEEAEGVTVRNADGTLETRTGAFKPVEGPDPVKAVLEAINAEPNVDHSFKGGL